MPRSTLISSLVALCSDSESTLLIILSFDSRMKSSQIRRGPATVYITQWIARIFLAVTFTEIDFL